MKGLFFQEKYYFCIRNDNKITNLYMSYNKKTEYG